MSGVRLPVLLFVALALVVLPIQEVAATQYYDIIVDPQTFLMTGLQNYLQGFCAGGQTCTIATSGDPIAVNNNQQSINFFFASSSTEFESCLQLAYFDKNGADQQQFLLNIKTAESIDIYTIAKASGPRKSPGGGGGGGGGDNGTTVIIIVVVVIAVILLCLGLAVALIFKRHQTSKVNRDTMVAMLEGGSEEEDKLGRGRARDPSKPLTAEEQKRADILKARIVRFFEHHDQSKVSKAPQLSQAYVMREEELFTDLVKRYGPEPMEEMSAPASSSSSSAKKKDGESSPPPPQQQQQQAAERSAPPPPQQQQQPAPQELPKDEVPPARAEQEQQQQQPEERPRDNEAAPANPDNQLAQEQQQQQEEEQQQQPAQEMPKPAQQGDAPNGDAPQEEEQ